MNDYELTFEKRGSLYNQAHILAPEARAAEGAALVRWVDPKPGETLLVVAAGGGFDAVKLANSVSGASLDVICVEPSPVFSADIPTSFTVHNSPFEKIPVEDGRCDVIVNMAALHHIRNREEVYREWNRLLKPGGRIVLADVEAKSSNGRFLNTVVDQYTPGGHDGHFLRPGELTTAFKQLSYCDMQERREDYRWSFSSHQEMVEFCRLLFGMTKASDEQIHDGIETHLDLQNSGNSEACSFAWSLRFFSGVRQLDRQEVI